MPDLPSSEVETTPTPPASNETSGETSATKGRVRSGVFISYSHDDDGKDWYNSVTQYLKQLAIGGELEVWDDKQLKAGDDWKATIDAKLASAKVAVLLITPTFLTSDFIAEEEVPRILERQRDEGLIVHTLLAAPSVWEEHPIGDFIKRTQLIHPPELSLEEMQEDERHRYLNDLVKRIFEQIGLLQRYKPDRRNEILEEVAKLVEPDGLKLTREIGGGDNSIIYQARSGLNDFAVKATISKPESDAGQKEVLAELAKCRNLQSPAFIRIYDVKFHRGYSVATTDLVSGVSLSRALPWLEREPQWREHTWPQVCALIILQIAEAIAEGHDRRLRFMNIEPGNILMSRGRPKIYPIGFSARLASAAQKQGRLAVAMEALAYLAPEQFSKLAERDDLTLSNSGGEEAELKATRAADQYALGMVTLTLLEKRVPIQSRALVDVQKLLEFHKNPRALGGVDGVRPWHRKAPALARIVWKMLEQNPDNRWESMHAVVAQLHAILANPSDVLAHVGHAKQSYTEQLCGNGAFYEQFYRRFFHASPEIKTIFAGTDLVKQRDVLDGAIERILNYRESQSEPSTLSAIAATHGRMGVKAEHFDIFADVFLDTLDQVAKVDLTTRDAWEAVLWPAIEYLKRSCVSSQKDKTEPVKRPRKQPAAEPC